MNFNLIPLVIRRRFANATHFCHATVNWKKLENMKNKLKNTLYLIRCFIAPTNKGERESDENYRHAHTYWWA